MAQISFAPDTGSIIVKHPKYTEYINNGVVLLTRELAAQAFEHGWRVIGGGRPNEIEAGLVRVERTFHQSVKQSKYWNRKAISHAIQSEME